MSNTSKQQTLVTGGAYFLDSHLFERLLAEGNHVICVDNFFTGRKQNIIHLLNDLYFEVIQNNITFPLYVEVNKNYNLARPASPRHYKFDLVQTTKTNVDIVINMLDLANC